MDCEDFWLLRKGWSSKVNYELEIAQRIARKAVHIIHCSLIPKPLKEKELWPIGDDKDFEISDSMRALLKKQKEGKPLINKKNANRVRNNNRGRR